MPMGARRWYQGSDTVDQLQRCECELVLPVSSLVASSVIDSTWFSAPIPAGLTALLGAAVHQIIARFAQPIHGKGGRAQ